MMLDLFARYLSSVHDSFLAYYKIAEFRLLSRMVATLIKQKPLLGVIMSKSNIVLEKATVFDKTGAAKHEVDKELSSLKAFRQKYPFAENLRSIEWIDSDKLFKLNPDEVGDFFHSLEGYFKSMAYSSPNSSNVYRNARLQIKDFRNLLRFVVDDRKSLAEKVDGPWERIGGLGTDKYLAKKIIFCFNYEKDAILPIFSNQHLRHFVNRVVDGPNGQVKYFSLGQEYEHYIVELLKAKNGLSLTKDWSNLYFARFLYATYPPPDSETVGVDASGGRKIGNVVTNEQLELQGFMKLLGELQKRGKIDGEAFREKRALWTSQPGERELLVHRLRKLLDGSANSL